MSQIESPQEIPIPKVGRGRERVLLAVVVLVAAGLRLWGLGRNGFSNPYYAAAVRSMLGGWTNFFFGAFDPTGFVTVDKPPVAIWVQAISARLLGYEGVSLLLPEALMGVGSVVLTYHLVRRVFGAGAGLLAGLMLAITPICVAVDRTNLPDSALVLVLLLAAWALSIAAETGRLRPLLVCAALVGVGFNIKMLAAFVVLPSFYLCYLAAAPVRLPRRLANLSAATLVLVLTSSSWSVAVELTPPSRRPYIGGSRNNSALDLALGYNGLGRVFGGSGNFNPGMRGRPFARKAADAPKAEAKAKGAANPNAAPDDPDDTFPPFPGGGPPMGFPPGGPGRGFPGGMPPMFGGAPGLLRFTAPLMAAQITWLFPIAIMGGAVAAARVVRTWPPGAGHVALLLWAGWLGTHWVVFSFAKGIFHEYYTTILGPAVSALAAIGVVALVDQWRRGEGRGYLPAALIVTAAWQAYVVSAYPEIRRWLLTAVGVGTLVSVLGLLGARRLAAWRGSVPWVTGFAGVGLLAVLLGPACWSLSSAVAPVNGAMPAASPSGLTGVHAGGGSFPMIPPPPFEMGDNDRLIAFLRANRHGERYFVAAPGAMEVSQIIIKTGESAIALGGFMGADPVVSRDEFARMVETGRLRFVMIGGGPGGGGPPPGGPGGGPGGPGNAEVTAWVREHGKVVEPALWRADEPDEDDGEAPAADGPPANPTGFFRRMRRAARLYDCRPDLGLVPASE